MQGGRISTFQPMLEPKTQQYEDNSVVVSRQYPLQDQSTVVNSKRGVNDQPLLIVFDINGLTAGNQLTCQSESQIPDFWLVSLMPLTNLRARVFQMNGTSAIPYRLGGGGSLKIPAVAEYLTVLADTGSAAVYGTVIAIRNYKEVLINGGNIA